jgi:hypothetical protein
MKEQILEIADKLRDGEISDKEAQKQFLFLFGVSNMLRRLKNHAEIHRYPSESFKQKLKKFISNYC